MTMRTLAAALLGLAIAFLAADPADASCEIKYRINKTNTSCLSGWWKDRRRLFVAQTKGGVTNECQDIGTMKVKVEIDDAIDATIYERVGGGQTRYGWRTGFTHGQYCCHDYGPCHEYELGSVTDFIRWKIPGQREGFWYGQIHLTGCHSADEFCKSSNMNKTWYCKKSFKAALKSDGECGPYDCGDRFCGWGDCKYQWGKSVADNTCEIVDGSEFKWKAKCKFKFRCIKGVDDDGNLAYRESEWEASMWKADDLVNCAGKPRHKDKDCDNLIEYNCEDETEICAVDHCSAGFEDSDADDSCVVTSMSLDASDWSNPKCNVAATCVHDDESTTSSLDDVPMAQMADLKACDGTLTNGDCDDG